MIKVRNNLGRNLCINLEKDNTLRLQPYGSEEIKANLVSKELEGNERQGYVTLEEKTEPKRNTKKKGE